MSNIKEVSAFSIKLNGQDVSGELVQVVKRVVVDSHLYLPDMFMFEIHEIPDPSGALKWIDDTRLKIGAEVEISSKTGEGRVKPVQLMLGQITALEPDFTADGYVSISVRGYDKSHKLGRGKKTRSFLKMTDSNIVKKVAGEAGLAAKIDSTSVQYDYVLQYNQTDMEFLQERAQRIGFQMYVQKNELHFKKPPSSGSETELKWGDTLLRFQPRLSGMSHVSGVTVRGWDSMKQQAVVGEATSGGTTSSPQIGLQTKSVSQNGFSESTKLIVVDQPVVSASEAREMATALCEQVNGQTVHAEGVCLGNPAVKPGQYVKLTGLGTRFSGKYMVTGARHVLDEGGYETEFTISGRQADTLNTLLSRRDSAVVQGVVRALVTNINDPEKLGRVKIKYPWLADDAESDWVRVAYGGGLSLIPEVNDEVLVAFEHNDIHHPYVIASLWHKKAPPPHNQQLVKNGKVQQRVFHSRLGHEIILDDSDDKPSITIIDKTGKNKIFIDSTTNAMQIKIAGDLTIDADGKISITSKGEMSLESKANLNVKSTGNANIEANGTGKLKSNSLNIDGGPSLTAKGGVINLN